MQFDSHHYPNDGTSLKRHVGRHDSGTCRRFKLRASMTKDLSNRHHRQRPNIVA
ncbi:hypothetical protein HBI24_167520 [Parastagonospora nodorum]|nr:hypothetical protein HBH53_115270 [Parastagonospora nodorum]KAH4042923.1 hypothetical protein HBH49_242150 [Parastagonospora nodorum]KAH4112921.1 hypothetical protein HBH47_217810 [Parastagonospora nodorum]KAH4181369.1 hypothetical protein HBH42_237680 [Parastagonospora nodorum]KAH4292965.1 hypothetical protein HBI01_175640 [Parastagonospora nodorum]